MAGAAVTLKEKPVNRSIAALVAALIPTLAQAAPPRTVVLDVQNMTCGLCPVTVRKSLEKLPGVSQAQIDFTARTATVVFDADKTNPAALTKATTDAGFPSAIRK